MFNENNEIFVLFSIMLFLSIRAYTHIHTPLKIERFILKKFKNTGSFDVSLGMSQNR